MTSSELRTKFLKYFEERGHKVIPSSSLVPENDPSVLFATAGMQQFKRFYAKPDEAPYACAASYQKCIRTGDIDEVGDDIHLTFFEMLGNFSFGYSEKEGSYFKEEAIKLGWEFLTEELNIEKDRMHASYFNGKGEVGLSSDEESKKFIKEITKLSDDKIIGQPFNDNFWSLGTEGSPGGPTVEFYVDGIEVWNLVFNEFNLINGKYEPSQHKGVDTGMGLERLLTVINGKKNVYETDLFESIIKKIEELSGRKYSDHQKEFRIITDHAKSAVFAICDGVLPSNKGAGYIVRRLIRRTVIKGRKVEIGNNFLADLSKSVFSIYKNAYIELSKREERISGELDNEENKFRKTLERSILELKHIYSKAIGGIDPEKLSRRTVIKRNIMRANGKDIFDLYQKYGLPIEVSQELMTEWGIRFDERTMKEAEEAFKSHQELSRTASAGMFKGGLADSGEQAIKYHTATHLLQQALREVLGEHVGQKGSNINAERMRFDFTYPDKMTPEQIEKVENIVNEKIKADLPITMEEMTPEEAKKSGAIGLFEHKYGDKVKVYSIGPSTRDARSGSREYFSREICGGPHVTRTSELGHFKILKEESSSADVRRIKAVLE